MMEIEVDDGNGCQYWIDIKESETLSITLRYGFETTGRWRLGGEGKPYDIVHPEL